VRHFAFQLKKDHDNWIERAKLDEAEVVSCIAAVTKAREDLALRERMLVTARGRAAEGWKGEAAAYEAWKVGEESERADRAARREKLLGDPVATVEDGGAS
jgi:hypothetical protein